MEELSSQQQEHDLSNFLQLQATNVEATAEAGAEAEEASASTVSNQTTESEATAEEFDVMSRLVDVSVDSYHYSNLVVLLCQSSVGVISN